MADKVLDLSGPKTLLQALLAVQAEATTVKKAGKNPAFKSKYVTLEALMETIMPILSKFGLVWMTMPGQDEEARPVLEYRLTHVESEKSVGGTMPLLLDKQNPQGMGSALTYARRQSLMAVVGVVGEVDDDGNKASATPSPKVATAGLAEEVLGRAEEVLGPKKMTDAQLRNMWRALAESELSDERKELILVAAGVTPGSTDVTLEQGRLIRARLDEAQNA